MRKFTLGMIIAVAFMATAGGISTQDSKQDQDKQADKELPLEVIPHPGSAAEAYYSPDGKSVICNARLEGDSTYFVYTMNIDGSNVRRINDRGMDACSYYFPDGKKIIWTSTRDCTDLPAGNYSEPSDYPKGAELFTSNLDGSDVKRLTHNEYYDAEVSVSPDGKWVMFSRQLDGKMDLWRMRPDGTQQTQITHTSDWQEGGAFFMPNSKKIIYRAWKVEDEAQSPKPMTIFMSNCDGTGREQITDEPGTNWAPFPAPDGVHFVFVKMLPPHNFEIFLMNIETKEQTQLTFNNAFDGYPVVSPDGKTVLFCSNRDIAKGEHKLKLYKMDVSSLNLSGD